MSRLKVYTYRNSSDTFLPADVIAALDEHSHIRQGRLFVWATSATAAAERLTILNLSHCTARALHLAVGPTVDGLAADRDWPAGTVLAMRLAGRSPVVEIADPSTDDVLTLARRALRRVGRYTYDGHFFPSGELEPEVTKAMIDAANAELPPWIVNELEIQRQSPGHLMRAALAAALRAQRAES
jgi:hypothetical protein